MLIIFLSLIFLSYVPDWICAYLRYLRFNGLEGNFGCGCRGVLISLRIAHPCDDFF